MNRDSARTARRAAIVAAHAEGLTDRQIADRLGITTGAVAMHLKQRGLQSNIGRPRAVTRAIVAPTPWDAAPGDPRPETAPRGSHMVSLPRDKAEPLAVAGVVAAIREMHGKVTA